MGGYDIIWRARKEKFFQTFHEAKFNQLDAYCITWRLTKVHALDPRNSPRLSLLRYANFSSASNVDIFSGPWKVLRWILVSLGSAHYCSSVQMSLSLYSICRQPLAEFHLKQSAFWHALCRSLLITITKMFHCWISFIPCPVINKIISMKWRSFIIGLGSASNVHTISVKTSLKNQTSTPRGSAIVGRVHSRRNF